MIRRDLTLRQRTVIAAGAAVALAVAAVVAVAFVVVRHELRGRIDGDLRQAAGQVTRQAAGQFAQGAPVLHLDPHFGVPVGYVQAVDSNGARQGSVPLPVTPTDLAVAAGTHGAVFENANVQGASVRIYTTALIPGVAVQVALPTSAVDGQLARLALAFTGLGLAGLAAAVALVWAVSGRMLAPVARLTRAAEEVAATRELSTRIADGRKDELGRLAASFDSMLDALARSVGAQRQLVADASHELRTPLASIRTNVEILRDVERLPAEEREAVIASITSQLTELTALVGDIVELARGEAAPDLREPLAFDRVVESVVDRARRNWPRVRFDLTTEPVLVEGVASRLDRAVTNLVDNAAKFSPDGGSVQVSLGRDGRCVIRDHGPGVPEAALPHVFDRFYRADEARGLPGSGLGLAIVRQVADGHGGAVSLRNAPDGGTVAELALPVLVSDWPPELPAGGAGSPPVGSPPVGSPPVGSPPVGSPPVGSPPAAPAPVSGRPATR